MLLKITTTHQPASDLSFLLHKHPDKLQSVELSNGVAHIFYPEASDDRCTIALLLDIDPVGLVRRAGNSGPDFALSHYVNDRPYVASSFLATAIAKAFSTAMNGTCKNRPELVDVVMPFEVHIAVVPSPAGGEFLIRKLFEPLGYIVTLKQHALDSKFNEWGASKYFTLVLTGSRRLKELLSHLYVLIPVLDNEKHYWVSQHEVEKLLEKGEGWLKDHPEKEQITRRYLKGIGALTRSALNVLLEDDAPHTITEEDILAGEENTTRETLHYIRLREVMQELIRSGARSVVDLGCGDGKLLKMMLKEKQFENILGVDVSYRELEKAMQRLDYDSLPPRQKERIKLTQGALTYRDDRLKGFDAAAVVEVIEHLDVNRLAAFERSVFEFAKPGVVIVTTPNREYNKLFETMGKDALRHTDHRFEWTRSEFENWGHGVADRNFYKVTFKALGDEDEFAGAPSQMAVFIRDEGQTQSDKN
jgi:3' terminal RNA ribose 2'-O-methyltransferase Hen1